MISKTKEKRIKYILLCLVILIIGSLTFFQPSFFPRFEFNFLRNDQYLTLLKGLGITFLITIVGFILGLVLGIILASIYQMQTKNTFLLALKQLAKWYVALFRGTPIVVQLLIIYYLVFISFSGNSIWIAMLAFGLNSGAYVSEILRGGIDSIPKGQMEAGKALGLSYPTIMKKIIIPQAFVNSLPSLFNEIIALFKETAIVGFIGAVDLTLAFRRIANATYDYEIVYLTMGIVYFLIILVITKILNYFEKRVKTYG